MHKYCKGTVRIYTDTDATIEELWKALPKNKIENTLVVDDGSGSMYWNTLGNSSLKAAEVADSLAIYFAENSKGGFKDTFITFGAVPRLVSLKNAKNLKEKIEITLSNTDCSNTNIYKVFMLILNTALSKNMTQEDLPKNILIISDMEFDGRQHSFDKSLFTEINNKFKKYGFKIPRLIFWNVCSRTNTIPMKENELGVVLVSGFSTNIAKMIMSNETDPYKCLLEILNSDRYKNIRI